MSDKTHSTLILANKAMIIRPVLKTDKSTHQEAKLEEAIGLAESLELDVVMSEICNLSEIRPATYIGTGKIEEYQGLAAGVSANLIIFDCKLSPIQQRNLEKALKCKVIDRTSLIIEIFASRARTKEGKLQVELASLEYQKTRLVRCWTHLERQRGGLGKTGGPGETQIELDRRMIGEKIIKVKGELAQVAKTRNLHRKARKSVPYPIVALVGYTNAGKSTLFNKLTGSEVYADDKLFATLDPTMRMIKLPSNRKIILSDTVGFISELPTELVLAFRATLEEVIEADVLLHVRDIAHPETSSQKEDVKLVLKAIGLEDRLEEDMIEVLNKIDLLDKSEQKALTSHKGEICAVSAEKGLNLTNLLKKIDAKLSKNDIKVKIVIKIDDGKSLAWLHEHATILKRKDDDEKITLNVSISQDNYMKFLSFKDGE